MPNQVFRAPGYYESESDLSIREVQPVGVPATVIGSSLKGPAFVPITVGSFTDFESKFGTLDSKMAAGYAMQKWLGNRPAGTFIRVLGAGSNTTGTDIAITSLQGIVKNAGMQVTGTVVGGNDNRHAGAVQFITAKHRVTSSEAYGFPMFTDNDSFSLASSMAYLIRGMLFTTSDARFMVMDTNESWGQLIDDAASIDDTSTNATYRKFKLVLSTSAGSSFANDDGNAGIKIYTASLNPSDATYIGKILNTDPERFETTKHLLYGDFAVDAEVASVASGSGNTDSVVIVSGSANTSATSGDTTILFRNLFGRFDTRYTTPKTPNFISQPFGKSEYDLFYVESLDDGEYANKKFKISITALKASTDPRNDYGTFSLVVRSFDDTDVETKVLEQYNNLSLNPDNENYIAKVIGDKKISYFFDSEDPSDRKLKINGTYPIRSKLIRVVMSTEVERKTVPAKALPFGFRGFEFVNTNHLSTDQAPVFSSGRLAASGSAFNARHTGSILPPVPYRFKVTRGEVNSTGGYTGQSGPLEVVDARYYWGINMARITNVMNPNITTEANNLISSLTKFHGIKKLDAVVTGSTADSFNNNKFTLARVALNNQTLATVTASAATHMLEAAYIRNGALDATNYYVTDGAYGNRVTFATLIANAGASDFNKFIDYTKFTAMMYGGWNGNNILDKNSSRMWDKASSTDTGGGANSNYTSPGATSGVNYSGIGINNNCVNSYRVAVDIATDEIIANNNILAIPGQRDPLVTDYASTKVKDYGLSFYLMDIPVYTESGTRIFDGDTGVYADVTQTGETFDSRAISNNAVAAYFPNIIIDDSVNNRRVVVPPSIAALAAFGYNDRVSYPWFAPAGFNRAALNFIVLPTTRINQSDRNLLNDVRINPIVKFPGQGYVLFSQRTLQQERSFLESVNVKRVVLEIKRIVSSVAGRVLFEQLTPDLRSQFVKDISAPLSSIQLQQGIEMFKIICDETNNTTQDIDSNRMNARIVFVPTTAVEYIQLDFIISPSGVTFAE